MTWTSTAGAARWLQSMSESYHQPKPNTLWAGAESLNQIVGCVVSIVRGVSLIQWLGPHLSANTWQAQPDHRPSRPVGMSLTYLNGC